MSAKNKQTMTFRQFCSHKHALMNAAALEEEEREEEEEEAANLKHKSEEAQTLAV